LESVDCDLGGIGVESFVEQGVDDLLDYGVEGFRAVEGRDGEVVGGDALAMVVEAVSVAAHGGGTAVGAVRLEVLAARSGIGEGETVKVGGAVVDAVGHRYPSPGGVYSFQAVRAQDLRLIPVDARRQFPVSSFWFQRQKQKAHRLGAPL